MAGGDLEAQQLVRFYDEAYSSSPADAARYADWRALGAVGKVDHIIELCSRAGLRPRTVVEVGCGDGALLSELHRRGFGEQLSGFEITETAVALARQRPGLHSVQMFDGAHLPVADATYDLAVLSHVLEHVPAPTSLLAELARTSRAIVVEVPLEANVSARRASKRAGSVEVGHLQRFDRATVTALAGSAGLRVVGRVDDALPLSVHLFFAQTPGGRVKATVKWAVRRTLTGIAPGLARRLFTVHHACLFVPAGA